MLVFVFLGILFYAFFKSSNIVEIRKKLFSITVIFCIFFFSSDDPFLKIQLYMYSMMLNIALSFLYRRKIKKNVLFAVFALLLCLSIPIFRIAVGSVSEKYLILKNSNTDVMDISNEMKVPILNFTIAKHFIYFIIYIAFLIFNDDLYCSAQFLEEIARKIYGMFKVLISLIIVEWCIVNLLGGWNDRSLMDFIFSLNGVNQDVNYYSWGSYNVALWFTERSNYFIILIFYLMLIKKNCLSGSDWLWTVLSAVACYCTGSSSALAILILYLILQGFVTLFKKNQIMNCVIYSIALMFAFIILIKYYPVYSPKILDFIYNRNVWGSAHFRMQSIEYGIQAFLSNPLFGVGIGTVYVHSMLVQTLSNIGLVGIFLTLYLHQKECPINLHSFQNVIGIIFILGISFGALMIQHFTSPFIITAFMILHMNGDVLNRKQNT